MTFSTFIVSLGTTALVQLGEVAHPETGERHPDLPGAKQTIDVLHMLRDKTRGNLTAEEQGFVEHLLHDLRLRWLSARRKGEST